MAPRLALQALLESFVADVYFQPPTNIKMKYPCIVYERDETWSVAGDNRPYASMKRYQVTVVDREPDSEISEQVEGLSYCSFVRHFATENLHHYVFNLFF